MVATPAANHSDAVPIATELPDYDSLPEIPNLGMRHAWDVWGRDDVLGSVNLCSAERVARAAAAVISGETLRLDLPLDLPDPPLFGRQPFQHHVFALNRNEMDDRVDNFHLQASSQWDALGHVRCREHGYWGGRTQDPTQGPNGLGIHHWAMRGMAGRGVLIDLAADLADGQALEPRAITTDDLHRALDAQGTALEPGDFLCIRFGWVRDYRRLEPPARVAYAAQPSFAGLHAGEAMARFLWNAHPAALCCDNPAVEVVPGDPGVGSLHRRLIPALGLALGEMFDFDTLAQRCRIRQRWDFMFVGAPLHVPNGLGSPANATAIL